MNEQERKDKAIVETKQWRQDLDRILQEVKPARFHSVRECALAITKIQEAIMWLGMDLKALNDGKSCYPQSYNPASTEVEPTADGLNM